MPFIRTLFTLMLLLLTAVAQAQEAGDAISLRGVINQNTYAAGGTIFSAAQIQGDMIASGGTIFLNGNTEDDVLLFGGTINVNGDVGDDLRAIGGNVFVNAKIGGDANIAGGQLKLGSKAEVQGGAMLAGGTVIVAGDIQKDLAASAGRIVISGHIHGNVDLDSDDINIQKGARIDGKLRYRGENPANIAPGAQVLGGVVHQPKGIEEGPGNSLVMTTLAIAALVFYLLFPSFSTGALKVMRGEFWKSLGSGVLVLLVIPFVAGFFMVIVFGVWLGLAMFAAYLLALLIGLTLGMALVGEQLALWLRWPLSSRGRQLISIVVAFVVVTLLQWVPVLGGLLTFLILLLGLGGTSISLIRRYSGTSGTESA